ncbi:MAG: SDR family oxidoreductase [Bryobacteraceae bacterium]|jgi:nucleoside-diphosphate-sugar epimerase
MQVLFIGGTGIISTACTHLAVERGIDVTLLTRGRHTVRPPAGAHAVAVDIEDASAVSRALAGARFDAVVDWIAFEPAHVERDIALFGGRTRQYIFISSASAYQKPTANYLITESTPLVNPYWDYSRQKIACEERLMRAYREEGFPITIVRPSLTYGDTQIVLAINSWAKSYTAVDRMRRGKKVVVPGDGSSLWVITHNTDFAKGLVGLLAREQAIGHAFHITSDEVMCWDQWYTLTAGAAGVEPRLVHIPSDFIAACIPESLGSLLGDKSASVVFDNTKIKRFVPDYCATVPFTQGIRRTLAWFDADPARRQIDDEANARWDRLIESYEQGMQSAVRNVRT